MFMRIAHTSATLKSITYIVASTSGVIVLAPAPGLVRGPGPGYSDINRPPTGLRSCSERAQMVGAFPGRLHIMALMDKHYPIQAFQLAVKRWFTAADEADRLKIDESVLRFAAIGEVLFWGMALDDTIDHPEEPGDLCQGLRFARNRATHDLLETTDSKFGLTFPITFPTQFNHYVWRETKYLPLPHHGQGSGNGGKLQLKSYKETWEGRPVENTIRQLETHFDVDPGIYS